MHNNHHLVHVLHFYPYVRENSTETPLYYNPHGTFVTGLFLLRTFAVYGYWSGRILKEKVLRNPLNGRTRKFFPLFMRIVDQFVLGLDLTFQAIITRQWRLVVPVKSLLMFLPLPLILNHKEGIVNKSPF